jgi:hypothetical protein
VDFICEVDASFTQLVYLYFASPYHEYYEYYEYFNNLFIYYIPSLLYCIIATLFT